MTPTLSVPALPPPPQRRDPLLTDTVLDLCELAHQQYAPRPFNRALDRMQARTPLDAWEFALLARQVGQAIRFEAGQSPDRPTSGDPVRDLIVQQEVHDWMRQRAASA